MSKIKKSIVEPKWIKIKEMYEAGTNGSNRYGKNFEIDGELDKLCCEFIDLVGTLTTNFGWSCIIEDVKCRFTTRNSLERRERSRSSNLK